MAAAHATGCPACAARLAGLRAVVRAARLPHRDARPDMVARAKGLMPRRPRLVARLLGSGLAFGGARAARPDDFALHVGTDDLSIPLRITAEGRGWRVAGRAPDEDGWSLVLPGGEAVPCPEGRFRFAAPSLDATAFVLRRDDLEIAVPSARELTAREA